MTQMATPVRRWFAVKGLFRWYLKESGDTVNVEERVVLFYVENFDEALSYADREAATYSLDDPAANFGIEPMGWWDVYETGGEMPSHGGEIYSRLVDTSLSATAFIRRYYPKSQIHQSFPTN